MCGQMLAMFVTSAKSIHRDSDESAQSIVIYDNVIMLMATLQILLSGTLAFVGFVFAERGKLTAHS